MKKKIALLLLCICVIFLTPTVAFATDDVPTSGTCGDGVTWSYTPDPDEYDRDQGGTLTISGNGAMDDFSGFNSQPWAYFAHNLKNVIIENGVTNIGNYTFAHCSNLSSIVIPNSVTSIGHDAFYYCSNLSSITIPDGVTSIGGGAFGYCSKLTSIVIPDSVTSIDIGLFDNCSSLTHIVIPANLTSYYSSPANVGLAGMLGNTRSPFLTSAGPKGSGCAIEFGWTDTIPVSAFDGLYTLTQIEFPDGVTTIGARAFALTGLVQVTIPDTVNTIGISAFQAARLTQVTIPNTVTTIGEQAFLGTGLTELIIPASVTQLGYNVFGGCQNLSHVVIQADASAIPLDRPLYEGRSSGEVNCPLLTSVGGIGSGSSIEIGWDTIPTSAFAGCVGLQTITIPDTVKTIGANAFGNWAFNACEGLTKITIPNSVTTIGSRAISYCSNLKELHIPASVIRINSDFDGVFGGCTALASITVDPANTVYSSQDGALYSKEKATLYCVPQGKASFTIPSSVTKIENYAFTGCANLTELTIPSSVTTIGYSAFSSCAGLTTLVIPESVTSNNFDFSGCTALTEVTLPGTVNFYGSVMGPSLTTIRISEGAERLSGTFSNLTTLATVYLPASLKAIEANTFANCSNLKNVYFAGTQAQWDTLTIADGNQELSLATVVCTGTGTETPVAPDNPDTLTAPETLGVTAVPGGLGQRLTVQVESGHWLTIQTRRAGSIAISSIQAPVGAGGMVTVNFSAPSGSVVQVWETENELTFVNGVPTNPILRTVVREL